MRRQLNDPKRVDCLGFLFLVRPALRLSDGRDAHPDPCLNEEITQEKWRGPQESARLGAPYQQVRPMLLLQ